MRKLQLPFILVLMLLAGLTTQSALSAPLPQATIAQSVFIQSPREGQALQGVEIIEGKIRGEGLIQGQISFSYARAENPTWFFIADIQPEGSDNSQASFKVDWDTNQITDGEYNLRVVAEYRSGPTIFELIPNLRIRNYSPVETSTPAPEMQEDIEETAPASVSETPQIDTLTPLPENLVVIKSEDLSGTLIRSVLFIAILFLLGVIYWFIRVRD